MLTVPIEVSARHVHLSQKDLETLFGEGYALTPIKELSQHGQYAAEEIVEVQTPKSWGLPPHHDFTFGKSCDHNQIRILGPVRKHTQVELSWTDCITLGITPNVVVSGTRLPSTSGIILVGAKGEIHLSQGIIVPLRHIHCNTKKAEELGLHHGDRVSVRLLDDGSEHAEPPVRQITFHNVVIRTHELFDWQMHIDTDEGNAAGISMMGNGEVIRV